MDLIASSEYYGVAWYAAHNSHGAIEHTVIYGLQVESFTSFGAARQSFEAAIYHAACATGNEEGFDE